MRETSPEKNEFNVDLNLGGGESQGANKDNSDKVNMQSNNGPTDETRGDFIGPRIRVQKRERINLAKARIASLKPNADISKGKIPDLNLDLSDDSRIRSKRRNLSKRGRVNRRKNKIRIKFLEREIEDLQQEEGGLEDDLESDWEEGSISEETQNSTEVPETQPTRDQHENNEAVIIDEVKATKEFGEKIGIDLLKAEKMIKEAVIDDQVDAGQQ
ncbi:hypothetical protein HanIR_Chr05g0219801 [Helianthus annuus]|nr:hypothetical protein HanIR_Chr05g0219801 [Helianthus annuus]